MSDVGRELSELRQEVVESRNQAIKTDNQVKNLTLDIRSFEKRFDGIDRRVRLTHLGAYGLLTAVVGLAACVVITVRSKSYEDELRRVHAKGDEEQITAVRQVEAANKHLADADASTQAYQQASKLAGQIFDLLDANQEQQAGELLDKLPFDTLSPLERRLSSKRFADLRHRGAEAAYRTGRQSALSGRHESAIANLRRCLSLEPAGRTANPARYLLAGSLYSNKQYDAAEPLWRSLRKAEEATVVDEATYYQAGCMARLGKRDEAGALFRRLANASGRFAMASRAYLSALENGFELPTDLPGGRVRLSKLAAAAAPPAAPAPVSAQAQDPTQASVPAAPADANAIAVPAK